MIIILRWCASHCRNAMNPINATATMVGSISLPLTVYTRGGCVRLTRRDKFSIATTGRVREYQSGMADDVRQLIRKRRYDEALEHLLHEYEKKVFHMALMMLHDAGRAEEVTQEIFLKVWQAMPGYDGRAAPSTWLYTIARNTCLSAVRAQSYRRTEPLTQAVGFESASRLAVARIAGVPLPAARYAAGSDHALLSGRSKCSRCRADSGPPGGHCEKPPAQGAPGAR